MKPTSTPSAPRRQRYSYGHTKKIKKMIEAYKGLRGVTRITKAELKNLVYMVTPAENVRSQEN